ncbi:MAG TPA: tetratricopeptide repeat protein [Edaphobacter sp.]
MLFPYKTAASLLLATWFLTPGANAQTPRSSGSSSSGSASSSSSSSNLESDAPTDTPRRPPARPRVSQPEAGGAAITLETSEPLFDIAVALNTCGYDTGLDSSAPVRGKIRDEVNQALASASPEARDHRDALCGYIREHNLGDSSLNLAQYISLSLYLNPPPQLTPSVEEPDLPPDSTQVVNILPLLRTFAEDINLHALWVTHRSEYEQLVDIAHAPLTKAILDTNIYLRLPVSSYDGRRFLVLLEPMLAPSTTNARIYGTDYIVVASPSGKPLGQVHMDEIRHTYLHYEIEPMVYARASAMDRLQPLLKAVQNAPLEFTYRSDVAAFLTECIIKAVEAHTMDTGSPRPKRPGQIKQRSEAAAYEAELTAWERQAETVRRKQVDLDVHQGWVLASYFYEKLGQMERDGGSLKEDIAEMVYGMDVDRERHSAEQIVFLPEGSRDFVKRSPRQLKGLDLAEVKLMKGDIDGADQMANEALKTNPNDPQANYLAGRIELMQGDPDAATTHLNKTLSLAKDPRTLAWAHIYLGRLYDVSRDPERPGEEHPEREKALAEYKAALAVRDSQPDTRAAAEKGLKEPFLLPKRDNGKDDDNAPLDPSGKAEKEAYRPSAQK